MTQLNFNNRNVGIMRTDRTFVTHRYPEHYFRKFQGFGLSYGLLLRLKALNCRKIIILYHNKENTTIKYITTTIKFEEYGINWTFEKNDIQTILPVKQFDVG